MKLVLLFVACVFMTLPVFADPLDGGAHTIQTDYERSQIYKIGPSKKFVYVQNVESVEIRPGNIPEKAPQRRIYDSAGNFKGYTPTDNTVTDYIWNITEGTAIFSGETTINLNFAHKLITAK